MEREMLSVSEHREFVKRFEQANGDMSRRVGVLEEAISEMHKISESTHDLAQSMQMIVSEQHEQHEDLREIRTSVQDLNSENIKALLKDHGDMLKEHAKSIKDLQLTPQDSEGIANEVKALRLESEDHKRRLDAVETQQAEHKCDINKIKQEPAENWKKAVWIVISCGLTAIVTMIGTRIFGG